MALLVLDVAQFVEVVIREKSLDAGLLRLCRPNRRAKHIDCWLQLRLKKVDGLLSYKTPVGWLLGIEKLEFVGVNVEIVMIELLHDLFDDSVNSVNVAKYINVVRICHDATIVCDCKFVDLRQTVLNGQAKP